MSQSNSAETHPQREHGPPTKLAPPQAAGFTLVLLADYGPEQKRRIESLRDIIAFADEEARLLFSGPLPVALKSGLSHQEAASLQDELATFDLATVFVRDEVAVDGRPEYLESLYAHLLTGREFERIPVVVTSIPATVEGDRFRQRFHSEEPYQLAMVKKARIMQQWAERIGANIEVLAYPPARLL